MKLLKAITLLTSFLLISCDPPTKDERSDTLFKRHIKDKDYESYSCGKLRKLICQKGLCNLGGDEISCGDNISIFSSEYTFERYVKSKCGKGSLKLKSFCERI